MRKVVVLLPILLVVLLGALQGTPFTGFFVAPVVQPRVVENVQTVAPVSPTSFTKTLSFTLTPTSPWYVTLLGPVSESYRPIAKVDLICTQALDYSVVSDDEYDAWTESGVVPHPDITHQEGFELHQTVALVASLYLVVHANEFPLNDRADCRGSITYDQV